MKTKITKFLLFTFLLSLFLLNLSSSSEAGTEQAPDFSLPTLSGSQFVLSHDLGQKNVVLNFWASWCESCSDEVATLNTLKNRYESRGDVDFVAVNAGDSVKAINRFVNKTGFDYLIVSDADISTSKKFGVMGLPKTIIINTKGEIVYKDSKPPKNLDSFLTSADIPNPTGGNAP